MLIALLFFSYCYGLARPFYILGQSYSSTLYFYDRLHSTLRYILLCVILKMVFFSGEAFLRRWHL